MSATKVADVIATYRPSRKFPAPQGTNYTSVDFDDTGEFLLLSRSDDTIQLFNTKAGAHAKELKSQKYGSALARFTHNSTSIIYASTKVDDGIRYLSMHDNSFIRYFKGHTDRVTSLTMSPGHDHFLSASLDNTVKLWDCRSPSCSGQLDFESPYLTAFVSSILAKGPHVKELTSRACRTPPQPSSSLPLLQPRHSTSTTTRISTSHHS